MLRSISRVVTRAAIVAVVAVLGVSGVASADSEIGQHGNYYFPDASGTPEGTCVYYISGYAKFHTMVVAPPQIWWPNTNSSNHSEHGTVGWSFKLQRNGGGGWSTFKETSVQKATAYEDQDNPYGAGTKAPFSKLQRNVDTSNSAHYDWRAIIKATWYKAGGGVLGSVTHRVYYYKEKAGDFVGEISSSCPGSII